MVDNKTLGTENVAANEQNRSLLARVALWILAALRDAPRNLNGLGDRIAPMAKAFLVGAVTIVVASNPAAAQSYCDEGIGLLIADTQVMLWQFVVGLLVIVALVGLVLRAFPLFTGATAMGNLMIVGVIVGVVGFVFILTFIEFAFGVVGGPEIAEGCSPFL